MEKIAAGEGGPVEKIAGIVRFQSAPLRENRGIPRLIFSDQLYLANDSLRRLYLETTDRYLGFIRSLVEQGIQDGTFRRGLNLELAAATCMGLVQTTAFRDSLGENEEDMSDKADEIVSFLVKCWSHGAQGPNPSTNDA